MPERIRFTKASVAALRPSKSMRWVYDSRQDGLAVVVMPSGTRTFYVYRWAGGKPVKSKIGRFPDTTVEQARVAARDVINRMDKGEDVTARRKSSQGGWTFDQLFHDWLDSYAKKHKRTWHEDQRKYDYLLKSRWGKRRIGHITKQDVERLHSELGENGKTTANRYLSLIKTLFTYAVKEDHVPFHGPSPAQFVRKYREHSRERFLQPDELGKFFAALNEEPEPWGDFFSLSLFTGARRGNVSEMRWSEINFKTATWRIPHTKNDDSHSVPLVANAIEILERRLDAQRESGTVSEFVFPCYNRKGHLMDFRRPWDRIRKRTGLTDLRIHDLRRSLGSWQIMTGASSTVVGKTLGHRDPKATAVYARLNLDSVREAMNKAVEQMTREGTQ